MPGRDFFERDGKESAKEGAALGKDFFEDALRENAGLPNQAHDGNAVGKDFFEDVTGRPAAIPAKADDGIITSGSGKAPGSNFFGTDTDYQKPVRSEPADTLPAQEGPGFLQKIISKARYNSKLLILGLAGTAVIAALAYGGIVLFERRKAVPVTPVPAESANTPAAPVPFQFPQEKETPAQDQPADITNPPAEAPAANAVPVVPAVADPGIEYQECKNLASYYSAKKNWKAALAQYKKALRMISRNDTRRILILKQQGQTCLKLNDIKSAKSFFLAAVQASKTLGVSDEVVVQSYLGLAYCFELNGSTPSAIKNYEKALELSRSAKAQKRIRTAIRKLEASRKPAKEYATASAEPAPEEQAPIDKIVGIWRGKATESGVVYDVILDMKSPDAGSSQYPSINCSGILTGGPTTFNSYKYTERVTAGRCLTCTMAIELMDTGTMSWTAVAVLNGKTHTSSGILKKDAP